MLLASIEPLGLLAVHCAEPQNGTDVVRRVWDGRANLGEVEVEGPAGHFELLTLRLYTREAHQWSINICSSATGTLSPPAIGEFESGRAEFYDQESFNGRTVLVRLGISDITADSCRFDQAFSADGGKTWAVNLIVTRTLLKGKPAEAHSASSPACGAAVR